MYKAISQSIKNLTMQLNINSNSTRINPYYTNSHKTQNKNMSSPIALSQNNINFLANPVITKTVSSKIASEKSKLLRLFKEILSTDIPEKTEEDILLTMLTRAHNIKEKQLKKQFELTQEMEMVAFSKTMNPQLKYDTAKKLLNELNRISKINPYEYPKTIAKPYNDNYDYVLINKFKNAIQNDNFDLKQVFIEHYSELASIQTVEELN